MAAQPGNSIAGPPQNRRKGRQKGPREFVGPMDHSYRTVNGNVADGPPSTIQIMVNGGTVRLSWTSPQVRGCNSRRRAHAHLLLYRGSVLPGQDSGDGPQAGREGGVREGRQGVRGELTGLPEDERPTLLVFDLNNLNAKPMTLIPKLKAKFKKATSIVGFLNHLQGDLKAKAVEAGCDTVMPRSAFSQSLPNSAAPLRPGRGRRIHPTARCGRVRAACVGRCRQQNQKGALPLRKRPFFSCALSVVPEIQLNKCYISQNIYFSE